MFGFGLATYAGRTRQENAYRHSWAKFYADNRLRTISRLIEEAHGTDEELRTWIEKTAGIVVPKLLSNGHLGGRRGIVPSLVHGDLWSGKKARGRLAGSGGVEDVAFDASCCYAHSEFELGLMRMLGGFSAGFFSEYHRLVPKTEPQSEYEDRMKLYQVYHWLNNWIIFRGGYRDDGMDCMQDLWKKYGGDQEEEEVNEQNLTSD